jgi:hypothetical protein
MQRLSRTRKVELARYRNSGLQQSNFWQGHGHPPSMGFWARQAEMDYKGTLPRAHFSFFSQL